MTKQVLRAHGLGVRVPPRWDTRMFRRVPEGEERTYPVVHAASFALPNQRGDYGSGAVEEMRTTDVLITLLEQEPDAVGTKLFSPRGLPRAHASDFSPQSLQRPLPGQSGCQYFFNENGRAFILYVVLGSHARRVSLVKKANELIEGLENPMSDLNPAGRLVGAATNLLERTLDRRGLVSKMSLVGAAVATSGFDFILRPGSAYASVCGGGASCSSGWTAMCCSINKGVNQCPPGTFAGGWWKATGASLCGGKSRYIVDCQARCTKCGCGGRNFCKGKCANCKSRCANAGCDHRRTCKTMFRYGQCNRDIDCSGPISCRAISCTPPWEWADCSRTSATDNRTRAHSASCLPTWSPILKRWTEMGSQGSVLGGTLGKEYAAKKGRVQRFKNGRMYWSKATGAHWINKELLDCYLEISQATFGLPVDDAHAIPSGRGITLERGGIYAQTGHTAFAIAGAAHARWVALGRWDSQLGYPRSNWAKTRDGRGSRVTFANGIIVTSPSRAVAVWGAAWKEYLRRSYEAGVLGYATLEERAVADVDGVERLETRFERGTITVVSRGRAISLFGPIHTEWRARGGPASSLGHPTNGIEQISSTLQQVRFRNGSLVLDTRTGVVTTGS